MVARGEDGVVMYKNWPEVAANMSGAMRELRSGAPEVMNGFSMLAKAALEPKALDTKTKELVALAIAVTCRCDGCITFHSQAAARQGATREEVLETLGMTIYMGGGPSAIYAAQALEAFDQHAAKIQAAA